MTAPNFLFGMKCLCIQRPMRDCAEIMLNVGCSYEVQWTLFSSLYFICEAHGALKSTLAFLSPPKQMIWESEPGTFMKGKPRNVKVEQVGALSVATAHHRSYGDALPLCLRSIWLRGHVLVFTLQSGLWEIQVKPTSLGPLQDKPLFHPEARAMVVIECWSQIWGGEGGGKKSEDP